MDGDLLGFINPSLTLFSADDEEAMTSCDDVTSDMTLGDDVVDVTLVSDDDELRIKTEPLDVYDAAADDCSVAALAAAQSAGKTSAPSCRI